MSTFPSDLTPFRELLGARCVEDPDRRRRYEIPERGTPGHASSVLLPESEAEVGAVLRTAHEHGLKLVISAGRTGLVEAQRPEGEAVLSLERLNRILSINPDQRTALVQAGVAIDALNAELEAHGLVFPMEMGSSSAATVGGCVANASAGANAVSYGTAAQMCAQAWGYWGNGEQAGPSAAPPWTTPDPAQLAINSAQVRPQWGLVGSQGLFGVITRAELRLTPLPAQREAVLLPAPSMARAMQMLAQARQRFGGDVEEFEFISSAAMSLVQMAKGSAFRLPFAQVVEAPYYLLLQVKSLQTVEAVDLPAQLYEFASTDLALADEHIGYAPLKALKEIRHSITESSNRRMQALGGGRLSFDTATPQNRFGEYLDRLAEAVRSRYTGYEFVAFGHAGVGGAHLHVLGTREHPVQERAAEIVQLVFDVTASHGGTFSAEHGVGSKWGGEFIRRTPKVELERLLAAKRQHDPHNVLNPRCFGMDRLLAI